MKKILYLCLVTFLCFGLTACGNDQENKKEEFETGSKDVQDQKSGKNEQVKFKLTPDEENFFNEKVDAIKEVIPGIELISMEKKIIEYETGEYLQIQLTLENSNTSTTHIIAYTEDLKARSLGTEVEAGGEGTSGLGEYSKIIKKISDVDVNSILEIEVNLIGDLNAKSMKNREILNYAYSCTVLSNTTFRFNDKNVIAEELPYSNN